MTWFNEVKKPKALPVECIKCSASKKGWILSTKEYDVFIYSNQKEIRFMKEALDVFIQNGTGREFVIEPDSMQKRGWILRPGMECNWFFDSKLDVYVTDLEILNGMEGGLNGENPFLTDLSLSPLVPIESSEGDTAKVAGNQRNGSTRKASSVPH